MVKRHADPNRPGVFHWEENVRAADPTIRVDARLIARTAGRLVEEVTELCLECGLPGALVMQHVVDALHNEAVKVNQFPSQLGRPKTTDPFLNKQGITVEIGDVAICLDTLRYMAEIDEGDLKLQIVDKLLDLNASVVRGDHVMIDGLMYKKNRAERLDPVAWAASRWKAEVQDRPLQNVHRRTLDDTWRQVIRQFGGDPVAICGPPHDELVAQRGAVE
jgi:hypothetical protein